MLSKSHADVADGNTSNDRAEKPGHDRHRRAGEGKFGRPGTCTHGTSHLMYQTSTQGAGMTRRGRSRTRCRARRTPEPKSTDNGPPPYSRTAAAPPHRRRAARLRNRRRARAAGNQAGDFARPLPAGHALGPDQRIGADRSPCDQVAELGFRKRPLLLAVGCVKPRSVRHFVPFCRGDGGSRLGGWRESRIVSDDHIPCTVSEAHQLGMFSP